MTRPCVSSRHIMERLWAAGLSVVKYTLFGLFVLGLNSLHQYHRRTGPVCSEQVHYTVA